MRCFVLLKLLTETKLLAELLVNYYCVNVFVANKVLSLSLSHSLVWNFGLLLVSHFRDILTTTVT